MTSNQLFKDKENEPIEASKKDIVRPLHRVDQHPDQAFHCEKAKRKREIVTKEEGEFFNHYCLTEAGQKVLDSIRLSTRLI